MSESAEATAAFPGERTAAGPCLCESYARATERAALAGARWLGRADQEGAQHDATEAMRIALDALPIEGHVVNMRSVPIAPTAVQPHAIARNSFERTIQRGDVHLRGRDEFRIRGIAIEHRPIHGKIGRIDLQQQSGLMDSQIFVPHLARERRQVSFVRIVMRIQHRG